MKSLSRLVVGLLLFLVSTCLWALGLQLLWGWFVAPSFSLAALSYGHAVGLCLFVELVRWDVKSPGEIMLDTAAEEETEGNWLAALGFRVVWGWANLLTLLGIAWVAKELLF